VAGTFQILLGGQAVDAGFHDRVSSLEVEENADLPGVLQLQMVLSRTDDGELSSINDTGLQPMANIAVVATTEGAKPECIFDGYILSHKLHLETGISQSYLEIHAQDASWLLNLEEKAKEWPSNSTDGAVANAIFGEYGIEPGPDNLESDSPAHTESGHTLMQRGSDWQFLRTLARRGGKLCRVTAGAVPEARVGIFAVPRVDAEPVVTLKPNDSAAPNIGAVDIEWDIARPSRVTARQALFPDDSETGVAANANSGGLPLMDARGLAEIASRPPWPPFSAMLTTPVDDVGSLTQRAEAVLRDTGWFVRCTGEVDTAALHRVLRVGSVVGLAGVGSLHSGKYLVWSVRHRINSQTHKMRFVLVRNAVGPVAAPASGGLPL